VVKWLALKARHGPFVRKQLTVAGKKKRRGKMATATESRPMSEQKNHTKKEEPFFLYAYFPFAVFPTWVELGLGWCL